MHDRRTALLDAAVREIATHGTRGLRVERVAKLAGVSAALIYHHFGDRSTLLQAALLHIGELADDYTSPTEDTAPGRQRLIDVVLAEIQDNDAVRHNSTAWSELRNSAVFDESLRHTFDDLTERWTEDLATLVRDGQRDGSIDTALDARLVGLEISVVVEGVSGRWLCGQLDTDTARNLLQSAVGRSLGAEPRSRRSRTVRPDASGPGSIRRQAD